MQQRFNYKLRPNKSQLALVDEWLITLRKHRNYCLREREQGYSTNNQDVVNPLEYAWFSYCDLVSKSEWGSCCPFACPVLEHGVLSNGVPLMKTKGKTKNNPGILVWDSASGIQSKRTTQLRKENAYFNRINSDVLQRNLAKLDTAYTGFWKHKRGFPAYRRKSNFQSFEYKPGQVKVTGNSVYLPGIGQMRFYNSRPFPDNAKLRTVTIKREIDGLYMSVLTKTPNDLPEPIPAVRLQSNVSVDVGINKLVSLSDGSHIENPKFSTNKRTRRRLKIRQRRVNRKQKGSKNRAKAGIAVSKLHKKIRDKREAYQWKAAQKVVNTADSVTHEDLKISNMKKRCKPNHQKGRYLPNGQSAKRGLNRSISDASWGNLFNKISWLALKAGKPVFKFNPAYSSQECSKCEHKSKDNRDGEKFICESCGHVDHADTQASRTGQKYIGLVFPKKHRKSSAQTLKADAPKLKCLPVDCGKVTLVSDTAQLGNRSQSKNLKSKQLSLFDVAETRILTKIE